jgi:hypothetical protein
MIFYRRCILLPRYLYIFVSAHTYLCMFIHTYFFTGGYVPCFIVREVKQRYLTATNTPYETKSLDDLREQQNKMKRIEKTILNEAMDYTNVIRYCREISVLRNSENNFRDYFMSEIDICRSQNDSRYVFMYMYVHFHIYIYNVFICIFIYTY